MANMLRKKIAHQGVCMYGEHCCAPYPIDGKTGSKWKTNQRRIQRRRERNEWKKEM